MTGKLVLIPTPIDDISPLETVAKNILLKAVESDDVILVEEMKAGRRRWLRFGLPREAIEHFVLYNEHTRDGIASEIIAKIRSGKNAYLMSDCGLPAFCDPGMELVSLCHDAGIRVTATPFCNSIALALSLSGFDHGRFIFEGFIPAKTESRLIEMKRIIKQPETTVLMDTPYRMEKTLNELKELGLKRSICLAMDLNGENELILRGMVSEIIHRIKDFKREFILIMEPIK